MVPASTSRCSPTTPRASSSACSTATGDARSHASTCPNAPTSVWHGYLPGVRAGPALRLSRPRPLRPQDGHRFNPHKLLLDPYARALLGDLRWSDALYGYRIGAAAGRSLARPARQRGRRAEGRWSPPMSPWRHDGRPGHAWRDTVIYEAHVKGMTATLPQAAAHERGTFAALADPACHRPSAPDRRHRGGTDAGPCLRRRPLPGAAGAAQLLGLQHAQLLRARAALPLAARPGGGAHRHPPPARRRHRGDARRRLQPHLRGQRTRPDAVLPGHRQRILLPAAARRPPAAHQRHRHRQHAQHGASARVADGDGQPAPLGRCNTAWTASASTCAASSAARTTASTAAPASSTRCARTRCSPR